MKRGGSWLLRRGEQVPPRRGAWPLPRVGSPARVGLREPSARLYDGGAKNSWAVYASCVPDVPSRCRHQTPATHSSLSLPGGEALFGRAARIPGPSPHRPLISQEQQLSPSPRRGARTDPAPWPCGRRKAPWTHGLGKKTALWSRGCWTDGWGT